MSSVLGAYGLRPVQRLGSQVDNGGYWEYNLTTNNTVVIACGSPVALVAGSIVACTATPTTTLSANTPIGIFMGCSYTDPALGFVNRAYLPANAVTGGFTNIKIKVADDPAYVFSVQANGSVANSNIGSTIALTSFGSDSATTGQSSVVANASAISAASNSTQALRIMGIQTEPSNAPGDAFTKILVKWNAGVHAYAIAGTQ